MKQYKVKFTWKITRKDGCGFFQHGNSSLVCYAKNKTGAINIAIDFAQNIPSWEFERNNIDLKDYVDDCQVKYFTQIEKITSVDVYGGVKND